MSVKVQDLLARLDEKNSDRSNATDGGLHAKTPHRKVTDAALKTVESKLGFPFPEFVRSLYLEVANGGFGPAYGIVGIKGGAKIEGGTLETHIRELVNLSRQNDVWQWPEKLLPLASYGCGMWACVDCDYKRLPMILWDPNNLDDELESSDARTDWRNSFWDQQMSVQQWLQGWVDGEEEPEPKRPTDTWVKRRLGFNRP